MKSLIRPGSYALGLAALWAILAWANEGTTYHLAPLLVGLVLPIGLVLAEPRSSAPLLAAAAGLGCLLALRTTALLAGVDRLAGESLLPFGGAVTEAVVFSMGGAAVGFVLALIRSGSQ